MDTILITKDVKVAKYAEESGVGRIMVDLEILGKKERQGHLNTVISEHSIEDVINIRKVLKKSKLLVRINPINDNSKEEIDSVIEAGAEILMLPMFKTQREVKSFIKLVDKRAIVCLLLETPEALVRIDDILASKGIDEIHIGLNDLHLAMRLNFMFELLSGGIIEYLANKIKQTGIKFGFGGIARLGSGTLDSGLILSEHCRLGSEMVILSRDFKGGKESYSEILEEVNLQEELSKLHVYLKLIKSNNSDEFENRRLKLKSLVKKIVSRK